MVNTYQIIRTQEELSDVHPEAVMISGRKISPPESIQPRNVKLPAVVIVDGRDMTKIIEECDPSRLRHTYDEAEELDHYNAIYIDKNRSMVAERYEFVQDHNYPLILLDDGESIGDIDFDNL